MRVCICPAWPWECFIGDANNYSVRTFILLTSAGYSYSSFYLEVSVFFPQFSFSVLCARPLQESVFLFSLFCPVPPLLSQSYEENHSPSPADLKVWWISYQSVKHRLCWDIINRAECGNRNRKITRLSGTQWLIPNWKRKTSPAALLHREANKKWNRKNEGQRLPPNWFREQVNFASGRHREHFEAGIVSKVCFWIDFLNRLYTSLSPPSHFGRTKNKEEERVERSLWRVIPSFTTLSPSPPSQIKQKERRERTKSCQGGKRGKARIICYNIGSSFAASAASRSPTPATAWCLTSSLALAFFRFRLIRGSSTATSDFKLEVSFRDIA